MDLAFEGFQPEAFASLERLRREPHIDRYCEEKATLKRYVQAPFKRYRDDLAVHWVLPNQLPLETERNVFSRILKNDFGAGGSHSHLWMAFYHQRRKRLHDVQLSHAIYPDRFTIGLYVGDYAKRLLQAVRTDALRAPDAFLSDINARIEDGYFFFYYLRGRSERVICDTPLRALPEAFGQAVGLGVRKAISRDHVLALGPDLVPRALAEIDVLWPMYRTWAHWEFLEADDPTT